MLQSLWMFQRGCIRIRCVCVGVRVSLSLSFSLSHRQINTHTHTYTGTEKVQFNLLCEQSTRNVYRKIAYRTLFDRWKQTRNDDKVKYCLDVFRSRVVFEVDNTLSSVEKNKTKTKGKKGSERLEIMVSRHEALLKDNKEAKSVVKKIIALRVVRESR